MALVVVQTAALAVVVVVVRIRGVEESAVMGQYPWWIVTWLGRCIGTVLQEDPVTDTNGPK